MNEPQEPAEPSHDGVLEVLIGLLNSIENQTDGRVTQGVTLCVKGLLISGTVVSRKDFLQEHPVLEQLDETFEKLTSEGVMQKPNSSDPLYFIHLKDAHIFGAANTQIPSTSTGMYWRGRLSSVDGFFMGKIQTQNAS